jgi:hypothetical protein
MFIVAVLLLIPAWDQSEFFNGLGAIKISLLAERILASVY